MGKYNNSKTVVDGIQFDSVDEAHYYEYLQVMKFAGDVKSFEMQPKFELLPPFEKYGRKFRATTYTPDFKVEYNDGRIEYIDVKTLGTATQQGELRRKMWDSMYPHLTLRWICRSKKHSAKHGWIDFEDLKKIYAKMKRDKEKGAV